MMEFIHPNTFLLQSKRLLGCVNVIVSETYKKRYAAAFGLSPYMTSVLWYRLAEAQQLDYVLPPKTLPIHLLWGLLFLKLYSTEHINSLICGVDEKTFRKWVWAVIHAIADLHSKVVSHGVCVIYC